MSGGKPGNKGGGRTPDEFKLLMQTFATSKEAQQGLRDIIKAGRKHPAFLGALKHVTEHGYGKPKESIDHTSDGKPIGGISWNVVKPEPGTSPRRLDASQHNGNGNGHNGSD